MANTNRNLEALVTKLVREDYSGLVRFVAWKVNDFVAEDAVSFALGQLALGLMPEDHPQPVAWVRLVAFREALALAGVLRKHRGEAIHFSPLDAVERAGGDDPLDVVIAAETLGLVDQLTEEQRDALELQAEGLSYDEMIELRGWSRRQVGRYIYEGRAKLRKLAAGGDS